MLILRLVIGVGLLWWALRKAEVVDLQNLTLENLHLGWLLLAVVFGGLAVLGWAVRWRIFVQISGMNLSLRESMRLTLFADFFNFYFLGPLGADGIRAVFLNKRFPNRKIKIAHSIIMDHAVGLMAGTLLYAVFTRPQSRWITENNSLVPEIALYTTDLILGILGFLTLSGFAAICIPAIWNHLNSKPFLRPMIAPLKPFAYLQPHRLQVCKAQLISIGSILCGYGAYWCAGHAVTQPVSAMQILAIMPMVDAIAALPITISGLGIRENLFVELLGSHLSAGAQAAVTVSLVGFAATGIWGLIGGIWLGCYKLKTGTQPASEGVTQKV